MYASAYYDGSHSITFKKQISTEVTETRNTWTDWHLIPTSRPLISIPNVSTKFVDIPGRGDPIDLTEYMTGSVVYGSRSGSWEFVVANGYEYWETTRRNIVSWLHGARVQVILEDVPSFQYEGRLSVSSWKSGEHWNEITINYALGTYAHPVLRVDQDWLWDPFNFETDYTDGRERVDIL